MTPGYVKPAYKVASGRVTGPAGSSGYSSTPPHYRGPQGPWQKHFAWSPKCINGRWYWLTTVYRREKNKLVIPHQGWEYGDSFDMLKGDL